MPFRFQLLAAHPARRPVIVLEGQVLAGSVQTGDRVSVSLTRGGCFVGTILGIEHREPSALRCSPPADERTGVVGLGVGFPENYRAGDIAPGVVTAA